MGFVLALFSFIFLIGGITTQIISYMTDRMYENTILGVDHQGLFRRCGDLRAVVTGCYWWNRDVFNKDPKWLQAVTILAVISAGVTILLILFSLVTLIPRFKTRRLRLFVGVLSLFNAILLAAVVTVYTTLNDRTIKFGGGVVNFSWSYWLLYGAIGSYLLSAVFFCCNQPSHTHD